MKQYYIRKSLREGLKDWDRKEFEDNSRSFELEMLYESVKTTLSAQQKNDLARFVRKAKTAEEVNTYMTGMLAKAANESLKEAKVYSTRDSSSKDFDKKIEDILDDNGIIETVEYGAINDVSPKRALKIKNILDNLGYNCEILNDYDICQILIKESLTEDVDEAFDKEPHEFWYYTKHGLGPGTVPKDVEILDVKEDDNWGTYIKLDKVLTTDELEYYDLKERAPKLEEANEEVGFDIIQAFKSLRNFLMEAKPRFCNEMDMDEDNNTITVFIDYGDWKHDHYYLNTLIKEWASSNNIECSIEEYVTFEDGSDTYSAEHIISFEDDLEEGYVAQKPQRFTNGQLKDFDPYAFIKLIMRSGKSMNSVRDCGPYQYTIFVNYKDHFGPRGVDDLDTLYMIDIIKEDQSGNQFQDIIKKDLLWTEVAEALQEWKEETILADDMRKNAAMPY